MTAWIFFFQAVALIAQVVSATLLVLWLRDGRRGSGLVRRLIRAATGAWSGLPPAGRDRAVPAPPFLTAEAAARMAGAIPEETLSGMAGEGRRL